MRAHSNGFSNYNLTGSPLSYGEHFRSIVARASAAGTTLFKCLAEVAAGGCARAAAVGDGTTILSYSDLVSRSARLCDWLVSAGVAEGDPIGLLLKNSPEFVIAAFACWKRGAALVPLNPELTSNDLSGYMLDIGIRAFIVDPAFRACLQEGPAREHLEDLWLVSTAEDGWVHIDCRGPGGGHAPRRPADATRSTCKLPATIQYSTGSTGVPKRVTRTQAHFIGEQRSLSGVLDIRPGDRLLGVTPFFHGYSLMYSMIVPLLSGASVVTVSRFIPEDVARIIEAEAITGLAGVPFMYDLLARRRKRRNFSSMRFALSGGAPLPAETARAFLDAYGVGVRQAYGSTETGAISIAADALTADHASCVGCAIPGVFVRILDDDGQPTQLGEEGHVEADSPFAARSYDNDVESAESHFTAAGFCPGDRGRLSTLGELGLSGRTRRFVNVGGNKVDPSEVEAVLQEMPEVVEAVVFGLNDGAAGERVYAVIVPSAPLTQEHVRTHCAQRLASFKQPKAIEFRTELPRSPLGKVLRKQLAEETSKARCSAMSNAPPLPVESSHEH